MAKKPTIKMGGNGASVQAAIVEMMLSRPLRHWKPLDISHTLGIHATVLHSALDALTAAGVLIRHKPRRRGPYSPARYVLKRHRQVVAMAQEAALTLAMLNGEKPQVA